MVVIFFFGAICADTTETHFPIYMMSGYAGLEIGQIVNGSYGYNNPTSRRRDYKGLAGTFSISVH